MKIDIIPIGNSRGIRIPKGLLDQCGFGGSAEIEVKDHRLVISPAHGKRQNWEQAFKAMAMAGDDALLDKSLPTAFDESEWEW